MALPDIATLSAAEEAGEFTGVTGAVAESDVAEILESRLPAEALEANAGLEEQAMALDQPGRCFRLFGSGEAFFSTGGVILLRERMQKFV